MVVTRRFPIADARARANVASALGGPGGPVAVRAVRVDDVSVEVDLDASVGDPVLVDDLVAIESSFVPIDGELLLSRAVDAAAAGLGDPELDRSRVLETYMGEHA